MNETKEEILKRQKREAQKRYYENHRNEYRKLFRERYEDFKGSKKSVELARKYAYEQLSIIDDEKSREIHLKYLEILNEE